MSYPSAIPTLVHYKNLFFSTTGDPATLGELIAILGGSVRELTKPEQHVWIRIGSSTTQPIHRGTAKEALIVAPSLLEVHDTSMPHLVLKPDGRLVGIIGDEEYSGLEIYAFLMQTMRCLGMPKTKARWVFVQNFGETVAREYFDPPAEGDISTTSMPADTIISGSGLTTI